MGQLGEAGTGWALLTEERLVARARGGDQAAFAELVRRHGPSAWYLGLVITGLGLSDADTRAAIESLPGPVTLSFSPYSSNPDPLVDLARARGHEMLVSIPMEPQARSLNLATAAGIVLFEAVRQLRIVAR